MTMGLFSNPCPTCGSSSGDPCRTRTGNPYRGWTHKKREVTATSEEHGGAPEAVDIDQVTQLREAIKVRPQFTEGTVVRFDFRGKSCVAVISNGMWYLTDNWGESSVHTTQSFVVNVLSRADSVDMATGWEAVK